MRRRIGSENSRSTLRWATLFSQAIARTNPWSSRTNQRSHSLGTFQIFCFFRRVDDQPDFVGRGWQSSSLCSSFREKKSAPEPFSLLTHAGPCCRLLFGLFEAPLETEMFDGRRPLALGPPARKIRNAGIFNEKISRGIKDSAQNVEAFAAHRDLYEKEMKLEDMTQEGFQTKNQGKN